MSRPMPTSSNANAGANATATAVMSASCADHRTNLRRGTATECSTASSWRLPDVSMPAMRRMWCSAHGAAAKHTSAAHRPLESICDGSGTAAYTTNAVMRARAVGNSDARRQMPR